MYVAREIDLYIYDITNPRNPAFAGWFDPETGDVLDVAYDGDHAYVACSSGGLEVLDLTTIGTGMTEVGSYPSVNAKGVVVVGDYAYVAGGSGGLEIIDISDPTNPVFAGEYDTPGYAGSVVVEGDYAFVADGSGGLQVIQIFQREFDTSSNVAKSIAVDSGDEDILAVRLTATHADSIRWVASSDAGLQWQGIEPDGGWNWITDRGSDLMWKCFLEYDAMNPTASPTCTQLRLEWLDKYPAISAFTDVPGDQGGWLRVHITRSGYDFAEETTYPIATYNIWQRVDGAALVSQLAEVDEKSYGPEVELQASAGNQDPPPGIPLKELDGKFYRQSGKELAAASFPSGTWELVGSFAATQQHDYIYRASTVADSNYFGTNCQVYVVTAHTTTPSEWYSSAPDSGWSVDNIAPGVPEGFGVAYNTGSGNQLSWDPSEAEDFQYFKVYRSDNPDLSWPDPPDPTWQAVHTTIDLDWVDNDTEAWKYRYRLTAVDYNGNESDPAYAQGPTGVTGAQVPRRNMLGANVPNPFNPTTRIEYSVEERVRATLQIYNIAGQLVRTLVDDVCEPDKIHQAVWNGRDDKGQRVSSGVYFYRFRAGDFVQSRKMVLLK
jgi:hypothetical protein